MKTHGINLVGYLTSESGLGTAIRNTVCALDAAHIPYAVHNCIHSPTHQREWDGEEKSEMLFDINLLQMPPGFVERTYRELGSNFFSDRKTIGYFVWETLQLPQKYQRALDMVDEIWTPSTYVQNIFQQYTDTSIHVVPHPIVINDSIDTKNQVSDTPYTFLTMFDYLSVFERKNPLGVIEAFEKAFPEKEDVQLMLKCINAQHRPQEHQILLSRVDDPRIQVIDDSMTQKEVYYLLQSAYCYVSLHRCEGFGLTCAEAMTFGKPVIATGYSGNIDFMNDDNSLLVPYEQIDIPKGCEPYMAGDTWADPDTAMAAEKMRWCYEHREEAAVIGKRAQNDVREQLSPEVIGKMMKLLLG